MTPNQVLNKVTAHEFRNDIKTRAPPSSPTHSVIARKQIKIYIEEDGDQKKAQVARKKRMQANAFQVIKKKRCTPSFSSKKIN